MFVCRDGEELDSQGDASSQPDTISIASRTSQNTVDSDKVRKHSFCFPPSMVARAAPRQYVISPSHGGIAWNVMACENLCKERTHGTARTVQT